MLNTSLPYEEGQFSVMCRVMTEKVTFKTELQFLDVSLTVHLSITLANDQLDAQFFYYIYYNSLHVHVSINIFSSSGQIVLIRHLVSSLSVLY
jgi:hypothetical protein